MHLSLSIPDAAVEAAHWKLDGVLCDFDEDTGRYEPIDHVFRHPADHSEQEEQVVREVIAAALPLIVERMGFRDLVAVAQLILDTHYPSDIFRGSSPDSGVRFVAKLREALASVHADPEEQTHAK